MLPTLIAFASLIPGLGFLLMGRWKSALLTWIILTPAVIVLLLTVQMDSLNCLTVSAALVILVIAIQWSRTFKLAKIINQIKHEEIVLLNQLDVKKIQLEKPMNTEHREHYFFGKRLETHLLPGESLQGWIVGDEDFRKGFWGNRAYCIGLLPNHLLICEFGVFDYPETVERIPLANVKLFSDYRNGRFVFWIVEQKDDLRKRSIIFHAGAAKHEFATEFNERAHVQPLFKS